MNTRRRPAADSRRTPLSSPLRLALPDQNEERRRACLYHALLHRGEIALPAPESRSASENLPLAPPLQRGRMVAERIDGRLHRLLGRILRWPIEWLRPSRSALTDKP